MRLQADDGQYYNFVFDRDGTINEDGRTSYKSSGWWAARGQWALANGYRIFKEVDPDYAARLQTAYLRGEDALGDTMGPVGAHEELHGEAIPAWLINNGSDVSSLAMLGLAEYYQTEPNSRTRQLLTNQANGVARYQLGGPGEYPYAAHPSTTTSTALWHAWGSHQVHALARAGQLLERQDWIDSAQRAADTFFVRLLTTDLINEMLPLPNRRGQIAYGAEVMTSGFWALYQATGDPQYARYAGLTASWFLGNNMAGVQMYDPETGRTFDGIDGPTPFRVNRNSGAESTIEALYALMQMDQDPIAGRYLDFKAVKSPPMLIVEMENGEKVAGDATDGRRGWTGEARFSNDRYFGLKPGDAVSVPVKIPDDDLYLIYASHLRRGAPRPERVSEAVRAPGPVTIDGVLEEWDAAQDLLVNTREQVLRGAAAWPGPQTETIDLRWMWDEENLYVAASVKDPQHLQEEIGPMVWHGDVLYLYLDTRGRHDRLDVKLTLAQTPQGAQVWNWVAQSFLPGAELAWQPTGKGYIYEAALPLKSLNFLQPEPGKRMNFDAGMGFTGGFINWTGLDPDTVDNLAPLAFVDELSPAAIAGDVPEQSPEDVAFSVALDGSEPVVVPQAVSPDRDYLWLDPVFGEPQRLDQATYNLVVKFAGRQQDREAIVDAFLIHPSVLCKQFAHSDGREISLCYDTRTGQATWDER
ncbi:MAG: sugar-binding protein [Chloroflexota bacterium]|nr:sugar-binding protein [Chloroflexota bacterium]